MSVVAHHNLSLSWVCSLFILSCILNPSYMAQFPDWIHNAVRIYSHQYLMKSPSSFARKSSSVCHWRVIFHASVGENKPITCSADDANDLYNNLLATATRMREWRQWVDIFGHHCPSNNILHNSPAMFEVEHCMNSYYVENNSASQTYNWTVRIEWFLCSTSGVATTWFDSMENIESWLLILIFTIWWKTRF